MQWAFYHETLSRIQYELADLPNVRPGPNTDVIYGQNGDTTIVIGLLLAWKVANLWVTSLIAS